MKDINQDFIDLQAKRQKQEMGTRLKNNDGNEKIYNVEKMTSA